MQGRLGQRVERDAAVADEDQGGQFERHAGRHRGGQDGDAPADGGQAQGAGARAGASRRDQPADHRAAAHDRGHYPVGAGPAVEHLARHQRERHLELPGQRADHRDHEERDEQFRRAPHVTQALPDLPLLPADPFGREQLGAAHRGQRDQHRAERERVAGEAQREPDSRGDHPAERGPEHAGHVHGDRIERDLVRQVLGRDHLGDEALPGRVVEDVDEAERQGQQVDDPEPDAVRADGDGEDPREQPGQRLGHVQHPLPVQPVREHAADRAEQEHGQEPGRAGQAELGSAVGQVEHEEGLHDALHPGPGNRDQLTEEEQPVVAQV